MFVQAVHTRNEAQTRLGDLVHSARLALTGKTISPGFFEAVVLLGKEKTLQRLQKAIQYVENRKS